MDIHIGQLIEQIVKKRKYSVNAVADFIHRNRSVVYDIYTRQSIDTGLLYTLSKSLNFDFFKVYSDELQGKIDKIEQPQEEVKKLAKKHRVLIEVELNDNEYKEFLNQHTPLMGK